MNSTSATPTKKTWQKWFHNIYYSAMEQNFACACWRLPNSQTFHALVTSRAEPIQSDIPLEELPKGFIFAPFDKTKSRIFLKGEFCFSFHDDEATSTNEDLNESAVRQWLHDQPSIQSAKKNRKAYTNSSVQISYTELVKSSITEIENGTFEKVVPSRTKKITLQENFDLTRAFHQLTDSYPNAFVSLVSIPEVGTWLGASPEILVSIEDHQFQTVALAGSQKLQPTTTVKDVAWTQKEIEEQALVSRYIINCFKKIRLREFEEHGPKTVVAGNILHLKTDFVVDMKATNFPQLGSVMLDLLHPTSAVCGMPLERARDFLIKNEGYDREFYSGYLGPINIANQIHLFVNLRCLQLFKQEALLYAGAGVTQDSIPDKEWEETELKMNMLLQVVNQ